MIYIHIYIYIIYIYYIYIYIYIYNIPLSAQLGWISLINRVNRSMFEVRGVSGQAANQKSHLRVGRNSRTVYSVIGIVLNSA